MSAGAKITDEGMMAQLLDLAAEKLCDRAFERLSPERIAAMEREAIDRRIGLLTFEEAAPRLQCKNEQQLKAFLQKNNIPVEYFGHKKRFVKIAEIEKAQRAREVYLPDPSAMRGTKISPLPNPEPSPARNAA